MIEQLEVRGTTIGIRVSSERISLTDHTAPAGFPGPPLHVHPGFDEVFVVLDGTLSVRVDGDVSEVGAGETAFVEGAVPHTFANESADPVRFLAAISPGGFEGYFRALAAGDDQAVGEVSERFGYRPAA
jgi:mannose-6-phosphate isomerase-like protein (cupin superfamily)